MAVLATDNFDRANASTLGANWTDIDAVFGITSNQASYRAVAFGLTEYTNVSAPNDQYAKCTLKTLVATTDEGPGPAVRISGTSASRNAYFGQCNTTEIRLYKVVAGTFTQLGTDAAPAAVNDVIEIDANGNQITLKKNGTTIIGPIADSSLTTGAWGLWATGGAADSVAVDNWEGGDFSASASAVLTGTAVGGITEADVVAGGNTVIITLTGDTFIT